MVTLQQTAILKAPERFFINGWWVRSASEKRIDLISPVTEEKLISYPDATHMDMDRAVSAARMAFEEGPWPRMSARDSAACLRRVAVLISERLEEIASARTMQIGAPIGLTRKLAPQNATLFSHHADLIEGYPFTDIRHRNDGGEVWALRDGCQTRARNPAGSLYPGRVQKGRGPAARGVQPCPRCARRGRLPSAPPRCGKSGLYRLTPCGQAYHARLRRQAGAGLSGIGGQIRRCAAARCRFRTGIALTDGLFHADHRAGLFLAHTAFGARSPQARISGYVRASGSGAEPGQSRPRMGPLDMARQRDRVEGNIAAGRAGGARLLCGGNRPRGLDKGYYTEPTI
jgi:hypothetical protein